jgi:predicted transcriptional regulator
MDMACINASGEISESARQILTAMLEAAPLSHVAAQTGLPLYRIRSAMRELSEAGLAVESDDGWKTTETGRNAIERVPTGA